MKYIKQFEQVETKKQDFFDKLLWTYMKDDYSFDEFVEFIKNNRNQVDKNQIISSNRKWSYSDLLITNDGGGVLPTILCGNYDHYFVCNDKLSEKIFYLVQNAISFSKEQYERLINFNYLNHESHQNLNKKLFLYFIDDIIFEELINNFEIFNDDPLNINSINIKYYNIDYHCTAHINLRLKFVNFLLNDNDILKKLDNETINRFKHVINYLDDYVIANKYNL